MVIATSQCHEIAITVKRHCHDMIGLGSLYIKDIELKEAESRGVVK